MAWIASTTRLQETRHTRCSGMNMYLGSGFCLEWNSCVIDLLLWRTLEKSSANVLMRTREETGRMPGSRTLARSACHCLLQVNHAGHFLPVSPLFLSSRPFVSPDSHSSNSRLLTSHRRPRRSAPGNSPRRASSNAVERPIPIIFAASGHKGMVASSTGRGSCRMFM